MSKDKGKETQEEKEGKEEECCNAKGELAKKFEEYFPDLPPFHRTVLYSIPILIGIPLLLRSIFCPPSCVKSRQCTKLYPGCCLPKPTGRKAY